MKYRISDFVYYVLNTSIGLKCILVRVINIKRLIMTDHVKRRCKGNMYCCVPQCKSYYFENVSFHGFPIGHKVLLKKWIHKLKIGVKVTPFLKVCSKHFRDEDYFFNKRIPCKSHRLKKNTVPSVNLPKTKHDLCQNETLIEERNRRKEDRERLKVSSYIADSQAHQQEEAIISRENTEENSYNNVEEEAAQTLLYFSQKRLVENKQKEFVDIGIQVNTYEEFNHFDVSDVINTNNKLRILTGIQNIALLNVFVEYLSKFDKSKSKLNCKKLILLTLMRIKLDISFTAISALFNISPTSAQTYFKKTINNLACMLKTIIKFPPRDVNFSNMPRCFDKFPQTRIVLDCTEVEVQKSKCLKCRIRTYSFYKSKHTLKFLIGSAPSGLIIFLSKAYGGRASDKAIFNKENLISKLCSGDAIMVDKGFLIDKECTEKNIKLIRPPFLRKKRQFDKSEAIKTAEIARARVHIERVIQRMKLFRMFRNVLPFKMLPYINNIAIIIVALTNLSKPILSIEKFS